jgi:putative endonuclease
VPEYFCYILRCSDDSYYTGITRDPERRLHEHNAKRGSRYTRTRTPLQMVYLEPLPSLRAAMRRERAIKRLTRSDKQTLIDANSTHAADNSMEG